MDQQPKTRNRCIGIGGARRQRPWARRKRGNSVHGQNARGTVLEECDNLHSLRGRAMSDVHAPNAQHARAPRHRGLADVVRGGNRPRARSLHGNAADERPAGTPRGAQEDVRRVSVQAGSSGDSRHAAVRLGGSPHAAAELGDRGRFARHGPEEHRDVRRHETGDRHDGRHRVHAVRTQERLLLEQVLKLIRQLLQLFS